MGKSFWTSPEGRRIIAAKIAANKSKAAAAQAPQSGKPASDVGEEFRRKKSDGHPKYIHGVDGNELGYTGLTSKRKTFGKTNKKLHSHPNPEKKGQDQYARIEYETAPVEAFKNNSEYKDWQLDPRDKPFMDSMKNKKKDK